MIELLDKFFYYREQDFMYLVEGREFHSEKELKQYLVPALAMLLKLPMERVKQDYPLTPGDKPKRCDIAVMNKAGNKILLLIELKLEGKMGTKRPLEQDLKTCKSKLFKLLQIGKIDHGILLTDKRCMFVGCEFDDKYRIENPHQKEKLVRRSLLKLGKS